MYIGRVKGSVVSTIKHPIYNGHALLLVTRLELDGSETGAYDIALDTVQAGVGDVVLILDEGGSARQILKMRSGPARAVIAGIIDHIDLA